jgi:hypothetical protein
MIGETILHYKIIEKLGKVLIRLSFVGQGGHALRNPTQQFRGYL